VITSPIAGVSLVAPINTEVAVNGGILSVMPPESTKGEHLLIQKTTSAFPDALPFVRSLLDGTQHGFDAVHNASDSKEFNPGNVISVAHITKIHNLTVDGVAAVEFHVTTTDSAARDFYLTWVHSGITNWYVVRTAQGVTPLAKASLDTITNSIRLVR
jgi:hypothetical protein